MRATIRLCLVLLSGGCGSRPAAPAPEAGSPHPPEPAPVVTEDGVRPLRLCVLDEGRLREVEATYHPQTGDTLFHGRPVGEAFPDTAGYAFNKPWYVHNEPITWERRYYTKYGPPRVLSPAALRPAGEHGGVVFFAEVDTAETPGVIFVPIRPGCEFHSYQWERTIGGVRGGA